MMHYGFPYRSMNRTIGSHASLVAVYYPVARGIRRMRSDNETSTLPFKGPHQLFALLGGSPDGMWNGLRILLGSPPER